MDHTGDPQVRDLPVRIVAFEGAGMVVFKDRHGTILLMVPEHRLLDAEEVGNA